jgi:hypothetical protein
LDEDGSNETKSGIKKGNSDGWKGHIKGKEASGGRKLDGEN